MASRRLIRILGVIVLAAGSVGLTSVACSSRGNGARPSLDTRDEAARVRAFLDSRYTAADVRHSFQTINLETIDCIDFFAYPSVKALAAAGTPLTEIPKPPPPRRPVRTPATGGHLSSLMFNGDPDDSGSARVCPADTVPIIRVTAEDIEAAGGLDAYQSRAGKMKKAPPPRPGKISPPTPYAPGGAPQARVVTRHPAAHDPTTHGPSEPQASTTTSATPLERTPPPMPGYCGEFESEDITGYAHVQWTYNTYSGTSITGANASMSIFDPQPVTGSDHSLMEMWMYSGQGFDGWGCSCQGFAGGPDAGGPDAGGTCIQDVEMGWIVAPGLYTHNSNSAHLFYFDSNDGYASGCYDNNPAEGSLACDLGWVPAAGATMLEFRRPTGDCVRV